MPSSRPLRAKQVRRSALLPGSGPLSKVPPALVFLVILALFAVAIWQRGTVGAALLGLPGLGVIGLLVGTWRVLKPAERALRVFVVLVLAAVAISMLR
jgi:hypothetical protein